MKPTRQRVAPKEKDVTGQADNRDSDDDKFYFLLDNNRPGITKMGRKAFHVLTFRLKIFKHIPDSISMPEKLFKVIIIGDPTVGKTSFVQRYVQNTYKRDYKGTVGVDFALKMIKLSETQTVKLQLWDIAGQERFTWMTRVYYKDAHGCVIMFDLTNKNSFVNSLKWKKDVDSKCTLPDGRPIPCILLANKCDLSHRQVDVLEIEAFHKEHHFIGWTETSAKEGLMVNDAMRFLIEVMMRQDSSPSLVDYNDDTLRLSGPVHKPNKTCPC